MTRSEYQQVTVRNSYLYLLKQKTQIHLSNIILLEAKVNYTNIYLRNGKVMMIAKTLKSLDRILETHRFYRIHRAFLINGNHLQSYDSDSGEVLLTNNHRAITSRRRKLSFEGLIK